MPPPTRVLICPALTRSRSSLKHPDFKGAESRHWLKSGDRRARGWHCGGKGRTDLRRRRFNGDVRTGELQQPGHRWSRFRGELLDPKSHGNPILRASGTIENVQVRNQNPGGCGSGIFLGGADFGGATLNVLNSSIDNFDSTGVVADAENAGGALNLTSNSIASTSASVQAGVSLFGTTSIIAQNTIAVSAGFGREFEDSPTTAKDNTIVGAATGIVVGGLNRCSA